MNVLKYLQIFHLINVQKFNSKPQRTGPYNAKTNEVNISLFLIPHTISFPHLSPSLADELCSAPTGLWVSPAAAKYFVAF